MSRDALLTLVFVLATMQAFTCIRLIEARHDLIQLKQDISEHDEMLETVGDDLTTVEDRLGIQKPLWEARS